MLMKIQKAYKFKLKPTPEQAQLIDDWLRCSRFIWNKWLSLNKIRSMTWSQDGKYIPFIGRFEIAKMMTRWIASEDYSFLKSAPRDVLTNTIIQLDKTIQQFFKTKKGYPKFKNQHTDQSGILFSGLCCNIFNNRVKLPKLDWVVFNKKHDEFKKVISSKEAKKLSEYERKSKIVMRNATVTKKSGQYWVSIQVEYYIDEPIHKSNSAIGIDVGIAKFATLSTGESIQAINAFKTLQNKLARENRKLARMIKKSNNWILQKQKLNKLHTKIANTRATFLHQTTAKLSREHKTIVLEDLKISNMSKSSKGTADNHGKNVKAKSGLNRAILDQGWHEFKRQLDYKLKWNGGKIATVNPCNTSRTCISCGHIDKLNRTTQSLFKCVKCSYTANADYIGAVNILNKYEPDKHGG